MASAHNAALGFSLRCTTTMPFCVVCDERLVSQEWPCPHCTLCLYCSEACRRDDWEVRGHDHVCAALNKDATAQTIMRLEPRFQAHLLTGIPATKPSQSELNALSDAYDVIMERLERVAKERVALTVEVGEAILGRGNIPKEDIDQLKHVTDAMAQYARDTRVIASAARFAQTNIEIDWLHANHMVRDNAMARMMQLPEYTELWPTDETPYDDPILTEFNGIPERVHDLARLMKIRMDEFDEMDHLLGMMRDAGNSSVHVEEIPSTTSSGIGKPRTRSQSRGGTPLPPPPGVITQIWDALVASLEPGWNQVMWLFKEGIFTPMATRIIEKLWPHLPCTRAEERERFLNAIQLSPDPTARPTNLRDRYARKVEEAFGSDMFRLRKTAWFAQVLRCFFSDLLEAAAVGMAVYYGMGLRGKFAFMSRYKEYYERVNVDNMIPSSRPFANFFNNASNFTGRAIAEDRYPSNGKLPPVKDEKEYLRYYWNNQEPNYVPFNRVLAAYDAAARSQGGLVANSPNFGRVPIVFHEILEKAGIVLPTSPLLAPRIVSILSLLSSVYAVVTMGSIIEEHANSHFGDTSPYAAVWTVASIAAKYIFYKALRRNIFKLNYLQLQSLVGISPADPLMKRTVPIPFWSRWREHMARVPSSPEKAFDHIYTHDYYRKVQLPPNIELPSTRDVAKNNAEVDRGLKNYFQMLGEINYDTIVLSIGATYYAVSTYVMLENSATSLLSETLSYVTNNPGQVFLAGLGFGSVANTAYANPWIYGVIAALPNILTFVLGSLVASIRGTDSHTLLTFIHILLMAYTAFGFLRTIYNPPDPLLPQ